MSDFGEKLRKAWQSAGFKSERQAAAALGWSAARLNNYTHGRRPVDLKLLQLMAEAFRVPVSALLNEGSRDLDQNSILQAVLAAEGIPDLQADRIIRIYGLIVDSLRQQPAAGDIDAALQSALRVVQAKSPPKSLDSEEL